MTRHLVPTLAACAAFGLIGVAAAQTTPPSAASPASPAKKELVQRLMRLQQSNIEAMARSLVEQPAAQMMREAGLAMQQMQFPQDKFQATGKQIEAEVRKYIDESYPIVRERAIKIAPSTIGVALETKMSEDELKQLLAWLESPVSKKFQQVSADAGSGFAQQVSREAGPLVQPKLVALDGPIRGILGVPPAAAAPAAGNGSGPASAPRAK
jgi:exonuclease VII large subunit